MPFLQCSDRTIVSAVKQAAWSPNKDLIACLTQDSQLHAYREFPTFTRIWSLSFQSEPTALCWHPDGMRLAVGHVDGSTSVISAENGRTQLQVRHCMSSAICYARCKLQTRPDQDAPCVLHCAKQWCALPCQYVAVAAHKRLSHAYVAWPDPVASATHAKQPCTRCSQMPPPQQLSA